MFSTIAGVEEAAVDGYEGVVVFTAIRKICISFALDVMWDDYTFSAILLHASIR